MSPVTAMPRLSVFRPLLMLAACIGGLSAGDPDDVAARALAIVARHAITEAKYGARAERYVAIEAGAAAQNIALQAVSLGLGTVIVGAFNDDALARALRLPAQVRPLALMPVGVPR